MPRRRAQVEPIFRVSERQANLSQLSEETGGEAYYLGFALRHIEPYFDELAASGQSVSSDFNGSGGKKGHSNASTSSPSFQRSNSALRRLFAASSVRSTDSESKKTKGAVRLVCVFGLNIRQNRNSLVGELSSRRSP